MTHPSIPRPSTPRPSISRPSTTTSAPRRSPAWALGAIGLLMAGSALAQTPASTGAAPVATPASTAPSSPDTVTAAPAPVRIGDATGQLLARQAAGAWASPTPRPIAGDVAQKSYERYLKSFDFPIPQTFSSTVRSGSGGGGGGASPGP